MRLLFLCILSVNGQVRLGELDGLQERATVQREHFERHDVVFTLDAKTNRFIRNRLQFKSMVNG